MPWKVVGGNADAVDGRTASFRIDLARTLAEPVTLVVESER